MANNYLDALHDDQVGRHSANGKSDCSDANNYDHGARRSDQTRATSDGNFEGNSALRASGSQSMSSSMQEWMALALANATQQNNRPPVASEEYISAALKIGHSLAKQLCEAEGSDEPMKPLKDLNWSEIITVHLAPRDNYQVQEERDNSHDNINDTNNNGGELNAQDEAIGFDLHPETDYSDSAPFDDFDIDFDIIGGQSSYLDQVEERNDELDPMLNSFTPINSMPDDFIFDSAWGNSNKWKDTQHCSADGNNDPDVYNCRGHPNNNGGETVIEELDIDECFLSLTTIHNSSSLHGSQEEGNDDNIIEVERGTLSSHDKKDIFDVEKAEILFCSMAAATTTHAARVNDEIQRIHSLGVVFYELFSGGMQHAEPNDEMEQDNHYDPAYDVQYNPLDAAENKALDLSSTLKLIDGIDLEEDYEHDVCNPSINKKRALDNLKFASSKASPSVASVEHLKSMSVPTCICDLIANMFDSINGDLSGDKAYQRMKDVQNDLEWMLRNVDRIIRDIDPGAMVNAGLLTRDFLYGRDSALDQLKESYHQNLSGDRVMALIGGPSGTGKSSLAQQMAHHSVQSGGMFLSGKFDQLQQSIPFSAIASAFNEYCNNLVSEVESKHTQTIASRLQDVLCQDISLLVRLIPNLKKVFGQDVNENDQDRGCFDAQKKLQYVLCQFVFVITSSSAGSVTLFLDDLQWADSASIEVISRLLLDSRSSNKNKRFFFLGCFRDDETSKDHPIWGMLSKFSTMGVRVDKIQLACLQKDCVNTLVSDMLCLPPRSTRSLSEIVYHKTKGNPQFVLQLLNALHNEGLLHLSLSRRRWEWDEEKIQSRQLPDDVAMAFTNTINQLSVNVKESMCVASCFGKCIENWVLNTLEKELQMDLSSALDIAVSEGLMDKHCDSHYFAHDRVQEAAYGITKPEEQCLRHLRYGLSLSSVALKESDSGMLFTAVDQINRGGPMAVDKSLSFVVADLNLRAGKAATEMSDFATALNFFDNGISYLRKNHWEEYYELSLNLYNEGTKCALAIGDLMSLNILTEQVLTFGRSFEDKLDIIYATIRTLEMSSMLPAAVEKGVSVLAELGIEIDQSTSWQSNGLMPQTKAMLEAYSDQDILNHKEMTNKKQIMSMKVLASTLMNLSMMKPAHAPEATLKMVQLSLTHGISPISPTAFAYYGSLLAACGEVREGYRFAKISLGLLKRLNSVEASSEVLAIASQVMVFVEPMQSLNEVIFRGHKLGMASGDTNFALVCLLFNQMCALWSGKNLNFVINTMEHNMTMMGQFNHPIWLSHALPLYRSAMALTGVKEGFQTAYGKCLVDKETESETASLRHNLHQFKIVCLNKMYVAFMFRRFDTTKELAESFFSCTPKIFTFILGGVMNVFLGGLVSFWIARQTKERCWFERGEKALSTMKGWAESSQWNFLNKLQLLEAEKHYYLRNMDEAQSLYNASISSAKDHKFVHEEALSCELAGYFFSEGLMRTDIAFSYFARAYDKYNEWGALSKVKQLLMFIKDSDISNISTLSSLEHTSGINPDRRKRSSMQ